jgi:hypothetical protein
LFKPIPRKTAESAREFKELEDFCGQKRAFKVNTMESLKTINQSKDNLKLNPYETYPVDRNFVNRSSLAHVAGANACRMVGGRRECY